MRNINTIELSGKSFPIIINNMVLEQIQEEFGTIKKFEKTLIGLVEFETEKIMIEPSVKAINFILPKMINEALAIKGEGYLEEEWIIRNIDISLYKLSEIIQGELIEALVPKKKEKTSKTKIKKIFQLILRK